MTVLNDTPDLVNQSNILGCGGSYATSAGSSALEDRRPRKRVSKNERKTMVETYVNEYVYLNFPLIWLIN